MVKVGLATFCVFAVAVPIYATADASNATRLTAILHDVLLLPPDGTSRRASLNDEVRDGTAVRTGRNSRTELTFDNWVTARLGKNSIFNFRHRSDCDLVQGAVLFQAPKGVKIVTIHAAGVALAISGTSAVLEHQPGVFKVLVLEGTARLYRPDHLGDSVLVQPGQMVFGNPNAALTDPVDFDLDRFVKTCRLIAGFRPLQSEKSIAAASQQQQREKSRKRLIDTNLVIFGGGTTVTALNSTTTNAANAAASDSAPAGPGAIPNATRTLAELRR